MAEGEGNLSTVPLEVTTDGASKPTPLPVLSSSTSPDANKSSSIPVSTERVDTEPLNGLRGLISVHIMVFHTFLYNNTFWVHILGSVPMSFFFLLSGFVLALNDGRRGYYPRKCCGGFCCFSSSAAVLAAERGDSEVFNVKGFLQRRVARTLPLLYLTFLLYIPLVLTGIEGQHTLVWILLAIFSSFSLTSVWGVIGMGFLLNGPSWFVSSIWAMYLVFPFLVTNLKQWESAQMARAVMQCFWIQLGVAIALYIPMLFVLPQLAWWISTAWPVSRLPVFVMGVLGGLLRTRGYEWNPSYDWDLKANIYSVAFLCLFAGGSLAETFTRGASGLNFGFQVGMPSMMITYIYILTKIRNKETNRTYRFLTSKIALFLGKISYGIYLLHFPVMRYSQLIAYGRLEYPECTDVQVEDINWDMECDEQFPEDNEQAERDCCEDFKEYGSLRYGVPGVAIVPIWIVTILLAWVLNKVFEEPMRKCLRPKKNAENSLANNSVGMNGQN